MKKNGIPNLFGFIRTTFKDYRETGNAKPFVIIFTARTGSNFLSSMLDSHPEIICHHELFSHSRPHLAFCARRQPQQFKDDLLEIRNNNITDFIYAITDPSRFSQCPGKGSAAIIGFKLSPMVDKKEVLPILLNRSIRKIILDRSDFLSAFTSLKLAQQSGTWIHVEKGVEQSEIGASEKVYLNPKEFRRFVNKRQMVAFFMRFVLMLTRQEFFNIDYSELYDQDKIASLLTFLGAVENVALEGRTKKQLVSDVYEKIENAQEMRDIARAALKKT